MPNTCTAMHNYHFLTLAGTLHYRERTGVDMHVGHRSTDISTPAAPVTTLPTHPACKQLSIYIKHMHHDGQLSFLDTRTCIQALCTTGNLPRQTFISAIAATDNRAPPAPATMLSCMRTIVNTWYALARRCATAISRHPHLRTCLCTIGYLLKSMI
jgi:hypothetical protein